MYETHLKWNIDRSSVQVCCINVKKISGYNLNVLFTDPQDKLMHNFLNIFYESVDLVHKAG